MREALIQSRVYSDTFAGGKYRLDMEENLNAIMPFDQNEIEWEPSLKLEEQWIKIRHNLYRSSAE